MTSPLGRTAIWQADAELGSLAAAARAAALATKGRPVEVVKPKELPTELPREKGSFRGRLRRWLADGGELVADSFNKPAKPSPATVVPTAGQDGTLAR